jgi:hypothetical protein
MKLTMEKRKSNTEQSRKKTTDLLSLLSEFGSVSLEGVYIEKITVTRKGRK